MIFMHIYALFAQNRRCPLTGWRKHAHPFHPESGYPKSALKISSRASRAARSRHVGYIFFFSFFFFFFFFHPHTLFPPLSTVPWSRVLPTTSFPRRVYIYTDRYTKTYTHAHTETTVGLSLSFFFFVRGIAKAGSNGWWWQKEKNPADGSGPFGAWKLLARLARCCASARAGAIRSVYRYIHIYMYMYMYMYIYIGARRHSNVTKGRNFVNFFSRRAAHRGGN